MWPGQGVLKNIAHDILYLPSFWHLPIYNNYRTPLYDISAQNSQTGYLKVMCCLILLLILVILVYTFVLRVLHIQVKDISTNLTYSADS
jgi:hypothetical protein